jgi:hypothetical protein
MNPIASRLSNAFPTRSDSQTGSQPRKTKSSKFDGVLDAANSTSKTENAGTATAPVAGLDHHISGLSSTRTKPGSGVPPLSQERVQQSLQTANHHLIKLKSRIESSSAVNSQAGITKKLQSIEDQYRQLDSALRRVPQNSSPQQLIGIQQMVYRMNENIGVLSKMVEQATGTVKTMLQTQV